MGSKELANLDCLRSFAVLAVLIDHLEMILASVALEYQVIDQRIFVALITMALTTSMLSGPMMQRLLQKR